MSFLQQLQTKRKTLKATTTTVTTESGKRFVVANATTSTPIQQLQAQSYGFVVDTKSDTTPACILADFLYLGSQDAVNGENISAFKLTHILSVGIETPHIDSEEKVQTQFLPCLDLPETILLAHVIPAANKFIKDAETSRGRVLVHCNAGVSRAASIVIAYLILVRGMEFNDAYGLVKSKRECIQPNVGFIKQLKQLKLNEVELNVSNFTI